MDGVSTEVAIQVAGTRRYRAATWFCFSLTPVGRSNVATARTAGSSRPLAAVVGAGGLSEVATSNPTTAALGLASGLASAARCSLDLQTGYASC